MQTFFNISQISHYFCSLLHASPQPFCMDPTHFVHAALTEAKPSYQISTVGTVEVCPEQSIIYWLAPLWNTSFVHTVLQDLTFSSAPSKEKALLNMHDNLSTDRWTSYGWMIYPPMGGHNLYYSLLKLKEIQYVAAHQLSKKMVLWFLVFPFDSSYIAENIHELFPQQGTVFL